MIAPPPDRDRKTDPPVPTDKAPPEIVTLSENVLLRLDGIESTLKAVDFRLRKLDEIHALLEALANKVVALYQSEIVGLREADGALLKRIEQVADFAGMTGTNGNGNHE